MKHVDMQGLHSIDPDHCVCNGTHSFDGTCWCETSGHPIHGTTATCGGLRLEQPRTRQPVRRMYTRKTTNHAKHIIWGFLTGGLWWVTGYPICVLLNRRARSVTIVR